MLVYTLRLHEAMPRYQRRGTRRTESASELYRPSDRRLSAKLVPTFADRGCHLVSVTDPYGRILGFLDRSRYFFFQVAPQLYSRG
jgi:CBS-domain-containing membrane protein